jgi:hypothetical protein
MNTSGYFNSILVELTSCPVTGCTFSSQRINTTTAASFDVEVARSMDPIKIGLKLCNSYSLECGRTFFMWNYPKTWRSNTMDANVVATLKEGNTLITGNMSIESTWLPNSALAIVQANERTRTWSHVYDVNTTTNTINAWVGCFNAS